MRLHINGSVTLELLLQQCRSFSQVTDETCAVTFKPLPFLVEYDQPEASK